MNSKEKAQDARTTAEWLTLLTSVVLLLAVLSFLVHRLVFHAEEHQAVTTRVLTHETKKIADHFVVPIEIYNPGKSTLSQLRVEVTHDGGNPARRISTDLDVDYLAGKGRQKFYFTLERDPVEANIRIEPRFYRLD